MNIRQILLPAALFLTLGASNAYAQIPEPKDFDTIGKDPLVKAEGIKTNKKGKSGFAGRMGIYVIKPVFDEVRPIFGFGSNLYAMVKVGEQWGIINNTPDYLFRPQFEDIELPDERGYMIVKKDGKTGLAKIDGTVYPIEYDSVEYNNEYKFYTCHKDGRVGLHPDRNEKVSLFYDTFEEFSPKLWIVSRGGNKGLVDKSWSKLVLPAYYQELDPDASKNIIILKNETGYNLADFNGKVLYDKNITQKPEFTSEHMFLRAISSDGHYYVAGTKKLFSIEEYDQKIYAEGSNRYNSDNVLPQWAKSKLTAKAVIANNYYSFAKFRTLQANNRTELVARNNRFKIVWLTGGKYDNYIQISDLLNPDTGVKEIEMLNDPGEFIRGIGMTESIFNQYDKSSVALEGFYSTGQYIYIYIKLKDTSDNQIKVIEYVIDGINGRTISFGKTSLASNVKLSPTISDGYFRWSGVVDREHPLEHVSEFRQLNWKYTPSGNDVIYSFIQTDNYYYLAGCVENACEYFPLVIQLDKFGHVEKRMVLDDCYGSVTVPNLAIKDNKFTVSVPNTGISKVYELSEWDENFCQFRINMCEWGSTSLTGIEFLSPHGSALRPNLLSGQSPVQFMGRTVYPVKPGCTTVVFKEGIRYGSISNNQGFSAAVFNTEEEAQNQTVTKIGNDNMFCHDLSGADYLVVRNNTTGKFGYTTKDGEWVIPQEYCSPDNGGKGYTYFPVTPDGTVAVSKDGVKYGLVKIRENTAVLPFEYDYYLAQEYACLLEEGELPDKHKSVHSVLLLTKKDSSGENEFYNTKGQKVDPDSILRIFEGVSPDDDLTPVDLGLSVKWGNKVMCFEGNWDNYQFKTLPKGWRLPTKQEYEEMLAKCDFHIAQLPGCKDSRDIYSMYLAIEGNGNSIILNKGICRDVASEFAVKEQFLRTSTFTKDTNYGLYVCIEKPNKELSKPTAAFYVIDRDSEFITDYPSAYIGEEPVYMYLLVYTGK